MNLTTNRSHRQWRLLYARFNSPIALVDCGEKCAPYNEGGKPFCCDIRQAVPTAYKSEWEYLREHTNLWQLLETCQPEQTLANTIAPDEIASLKAETPANQVLIACLGPVHCQRQYRSITCRAFPFFPYLRSDGQWIGVSYYWEYEQSCWIISNLDQVCQAYLHEFINAYQAIFTYLPEEQDNFAFHSQEMRRVFGKRRRKIILLGHDGIFYKIHPVTETMEAITAKDLPKFGPYRLAQKLPFPEE